ncbi:MAG: 4-alpha-glucanotransferase [Dorea sp.]
MESKAYRTYLEEEKAWLADYALYMAVKDSFDGKSWDQWEEDIRLRKPEAIAAYQGTIKCRISFEFLQYLFMERSRAGTSICHQ